MSPTEALFVGWQTCNNLIMKKNESSRGKPDERTEIRETTHRVMGSRQSQKSVERSGQRRQPKTGGTGGHGKGGQS